MTNFINLTPHEIKIIEDDTVISVPPSGKSLRIACEFVKFGEIDGVTTYRAKYGEFELVENANPSNKTPGLPQIMPGPTYIVSGQCLEALRDSNRLDFAAPGELVRDAGGQPIGCRGLKVN